MISRNAETLDGLHEYFSRTGVSSSSRSELNPLADVPERVRVLVVFPDDFPAHEVATYLSVVRTRRRDLGLVIISKDPPTYTAMTAMNGHPLHATVLPRPAFGWRIVDAIRESSARSTQ